ncbi:MAG: SET domain-containing protein-lysine N-methyltransferase [Acidobacteria bacterium]|nr:SET domain-containing protein-lysine N-methyltransferase [Acidobacteriota bacterium]MBI3424854.1 SET domain-containing protein-lysine N-methyltransferase [Acidobacteriota bacterium]
MQLSDTRDFYVIPNEDGKGAGLFATHAFAAGEDLYRMDYWSEVVMPMHATNHSCAPNAAFDNGGMLVALRDIGADREITYDYRRTPTPASPWNFACLCQSADCVGWLRSG